MRRRRLWITLTGLLIAGVLLTAMAIGLTALARIDIWAQRGGRLSPRFQYGLSEHEKTDPALLLYREASPIAVELENPRAIATGADGTIYVAGDRAIAVFSADGAARPSISLEDEPRCLVADSGLLYVGMKDHVEVFNAEGVRKASWESAGPKAQFTSLALLEGEVFVADAGHRVVWRYAADGKRLGQIGGHQEGRESVLFVIPSPYFDVAAAPDGLLRIANPGKHRVETFSPEGDAGDSWGKASMRIEGFCGCCNPANFAILPDGRFVTVEKGLPRVKIYSKEGQFEGVVAGPESFLSRTLRAEETRDDHRPKVLDVATDRRGRVLVLDPSTRQVRIFVSKTELS